MAMETLKVEVSKNNFVGSDKRPVLVRITLKDGMVYQTPCTKEEAINLVKKKIERL